MVKIWLLQNAIAFWGIKVQIVPYHFVSKRILGAHPFCRFFSMPPILCLEKGGSDPMGLISTGVFQPLPPLPHITTPRQSWERINDGSTDAASSTWRNSDAHTGDACREPMMPPPMQTMQAPGLCWNLPDTSRHGKLFSPNP